MSALLNRLALCLTGAVLVAGLLVGCGGGSDSSEGKTSANGTRSYEEICLEAREGAAGMNGVIKETCAEHGITETSPPKSSAAAQKARSGDAASSAREDQKYNEEPVHESYNRTAAMADLSTGEPEAAREKLAEGCPKSSPAEVDEAFKQLEEIVSGPEAASVAQLEGELEDLCPL
jgi:hypothetical protein